MKDLSPEFEMLTYVPKSYPLSVPYWRMLSAWSFDVEVDVGKIHQP